MLLRRRLQPWYVWLCLVWEEELLQLVLGVACDGDDVGLDEYDGDGGLKVLRWHEKRWLGMWGGVIRDRECGRDGGYRHVSCVN